MISRLYIHNYRCLENFELPISGRSSALLIGKNGSGKTTVGYALELFQRIARGTNRVGELVRPKDLSRGRSDVPMRFEIEANLAGKSYSYGLAFEYPEGFRELRVFQEKLTIDGKNIYTRDISTVHLARAGRDQEAIFSIDWHLVALPIIQQQSPSDPVNSFKQWLSRMLILRPIPSQILGHSQDESLQPDTRAVEVGAWFTGLMAHAPSSYSRVYGYLKDLISDLDEITNPTVGTDSRSLFVQFSSEQGRMRLPFEDLSDGEKCFFISALVLAANKAYGPIFCFWDEPDNYLAPSEVGHFVMTLRNAFQSGGQFLATSHNIETIRRFSDENTLVFYRNSHLEPTIVRSLENVQRSGDLASAIVRGDLDL